MGKTQTGLCCLIDKLDRGLKFWILKFEVKNYVVTAEEIRCIFNDI